MNLKTFYENHTNFSLRSLSEYFISPGIKCKFDILLKHIEYNKIFTNSVDLGCSGDSILTFLDNPQKKSFVDIASVPLNQYLPKKSSTSQRSFKKENWNPLCGDLMKLPYRDQVFDLIFSLDTLEHIKNDKLAISEISRILKKKGLAVITVPHRKKYYTTQDKIIGHYRRYEVKGLINLFKRYNLKLLNYYGVYGQLMRVSKLQSIAPNKTEKSILKLRNNYISNQFFRKSWKIINFIISKLMKIDAKYQPLKRVMNMGFLFQKV